MTEKNVFTSDEAMEMLNEGSNESNSRNEFTYLKSGDSFKVKVPGINMKSEFVYGSFSKKIHSFIAKNPSKKSEKGYPVEDLTPFDQAWKYFKDKSSDFNDDNSKEASHYRCQRKFTFGLYDLDSGDPIMVEFTRNQANAIVSAIKKYEGKLDKFAFELSKQGTGTNTIVSLTIIPMMDDLTEKQADNFDKLPNDFDSNLFTGLHYEADENEQIKSLQQAGFDISLIGLEAPKSDDDSANVFEVESGEDDGAFPF